MMVAFATMELSSQKASDLLEEGRAQTKTPLVQSFRGLLTTQLSTWTTDLKICLKNLSLV